MNETIVYLVRHSEAAPNVNFKNISNSSNNQINEEKRILSIMGEKKAEILARNPELQNIDAIYSSNYVRALATAKYFALENNTIINIDDRFNERKVGKEENLDWNDFERHQAKDFNYKLNGGESINDVKKRMTQAMKNVLMFESGNRVLVVSHATAIMALLSAWCEIGRNYDDKVILTYNDQPIVDGEWTSPCVFKIVFDGMNVLSVECLNI